MTLILTGGLVLVALVSSSGHALADSSDLLLTTTPPPPGFTKTLSCPFAYQGTDESPFDGNDGTFCTVDNGDPHNVTVDYNRTPEPSQGFTIRSFRVRVDHTSSTEPISRAFLMSMRVNCGNNGQAGRPPVWHAPADMLTRAALRPLGALDTGRVDFDTPCEIVSNGGISLHWLSSFPSAPFCCAGLRIYSFEAYAESSPVSDSAPSVTGRMPASGARKIAVGANVRVTFSEAVDVAGSWFSISCGSSRAHLASVSGGPTTYTLNPKKNFSFGKTCTVTIVAAQVTDRDVIDGPDSLTENVTWTFTTVRDQDDDDGDDDDDDGDDEDD